MARGQKLLSHPARSNQSGVCHRQNVRPDMKLLLTGCLISVIGCVPMRHDADVRRFRELTGEANSPIRREAVSRLFPIARGRGVLPPTTGQKVPESLHVEEAWKLPSGNFLIIEDDTQMKSVIEVFDNPGRIARQTVDVASSLRLVSIDGRAIANWSARPMTRGYRSCLSYPRLQAAIPPG